MALPPKAPLRFHPIIYFSYSRYFKLSCADFLFLSQKQKPSQNNPNRPDRQLQIQLAGINQKQQHSPLTQKLRALTAVDTNRKKIYFAYKVMDDNNIWQVWTAVSDLDGKGWKEVQQTKICRKHGTRLADLQPKKISSTISTEPKPSGLMMATKIPLKKNGKNIKPLAGKLTISQALLWTMCTAELFLPTQGFTNRHRHLGSFQS